MEKYITRDKLTDFVEQMWDLGIKCELRPDEQECVLWSDGFGTMEHIAVVDKRSYNGLIEEIMAKFLCKKEE